MEAGYKNIINIALATLGKSAVSEIEISQDFVVKNLISHIDTAAREVCSIPNITSVRKRINVQAEINNNIPKPFNFCYPLPADYLRLFDIDECFNEYEVAIDDINNRWVLYTKYKVESLVYARVPAWDLMDQMLRIAIGTKLALMVSLIHTESEAKVQQCQAKYDLALQNAIGKDVFDRSPDVIFSSTWLENMRR